MEAHFELSDKVFTAQLKDGSLPPSLFSHLAHLRLAWIHITQFGIDNAIANITSQIKNYTRLLGAEDKYHETVTVAAIRAVYHFMLKSETTNFSNFILENPRLETDFKNILASHYGFNLFTSAEAKVKYIEPDLLKFD